MECVTGVEPACNGFAIRGLTVQLHTHIWRPVADSNRCEQDENLLSLPLDERDTGIWLANQIH